MTFSIIVAQAREAQERVRREEGDKAACEYAHSQAGACLGLGGGTITGMVIGSVVPVVGTVIGGMVGGVVGFAKGGRDRNGRDNLRSAGGYLLSLKRAFGV